MNCEHVIIVYSLCSLAVFVYPYLIFFSFLSNEGWISPTPSSLSGVIHSLVILTECNHNCITRDVK